MLQQKLEQKEQERQALDRELSGIMEQNDILQVKIIQYEEEIQSVKVTFLSFASLLTFVSDLWGRFQSKERPCLEG